MGTNSTGNEELDDRINWLSEVLDAARFLYDEMTYQALVQMADEMQRFNKYTKFTPVATEPDEVATQRVGELLKMRTGEPN